MPDPAPPTAADALREAAAELELLQDQVRLLMNPEQRKKARAMREDRLPSKPESKAIADLFRRKHSTPWSLKEKASYIAAKESGEVTLENLALIASYYEQERAKGAEGCYRRDLLTFLNGFLGELDRARNSPAQRRLEKAKAKPANIIKLEQPTTDEQRAQMAAEASRLAAELRERTGAK